MMKRFILPVTLTLALLASLGLNVYQRNTEKTLRTQIIGIRQRALIEAVDAMQDVEVRLSKLLVSSGASQSVQLLNQTAKQAQEVEQNLSQLPMRHEAVSGTITFVNQLGAYADTLSKKILSGAILSNDDAEQVTSLVESCAQLNTQLATLGDAVNTGIGLEDAQMWSDSGLNPLPLELATGSDNGIDYPTLIYDGPFSEGRHDAVPKGLRGEEISQEQAMALARVFVGEERIVDIVHSADSGGTIPAYGFTVTTKDVVLDVQVTKTGGHVLFMMPEGAQFSGQMGLTDCIMKAYEFLSSRGYGHMEPSFYQTYSGMAVINFAATQDGILLYPDLVKVQIRMDTGEVVGIESNNYLMNHVKRENVSVALSEDEALAYVNERLEIERTRLCVIPKESGERLCYEFTGTFAGATYLVYIDAITGAQADVLKVIAAQGALLTV